MRKALVVFGLLSLMGCGAENDSSNEVVARVGDWVLSVGRLAEILVLAQPFPLEEEPVAPLVRHWVEVTALAQRAVQGGSLYSEELILSSKWNEVRDEVLAEFRSQEFGDQTPVQPENIDQVYSGSEVRAVAQVFRRAGPEVSEEIRVNQLAAIREVRARLVAGGPWTEANESNQHVESRQRGGLMLVRRGRGPSQISDVAFSLRPGELSRVFSSPEGFHLLVRPRLEEVRTAFANLLAEEEGADSEADLVEALAEDRGLRVLPGAAEVLRQVAEDPMGEMDNQEVLAEFTGGTLTAGQAAKFLHFLPMEIRPEIIEGPDWGVEDFARQLAQLELLWTHVEEAGYELTEIGSAAVREGYEADLSLLWNALEIDPDLISDEGRAVEQRQAEVRRQLDLYMESVAARTKTLQTVPPFLAINLLEEVEWEIDPEGIEEAMATAQRLLDLAGYEEVG